MGAGITTKDLVYGENNHEDVQLEAVDDQNQA
jgi:hypothetical protein